MSELIALPFTLFVRPGTSCEEFWNCEHVHLYEVHFSMPVKERNLMLQHRWNLKRSVQKKLADKNRDPEMLNALRQDIQREIRKASMIRPVRSALLVDHKGVPCTAQRAVRLRIEKKTPPQADGHWVTELNTLLSQIPCPEGTVTVQDPQPKAQTPKKRTLSDYFSVPTHRTPPLSGQQLFASPSNRHTPPSGSNANPPRPRRKA